MLRCFVFGLSFFVLFSAELSAADAPPKILGYERLAGSKDLSDVSAGELLLGELNCNSCHQAAESLATRINRKPAPILDHIGSRARPQYLIKFLDNPQATKAGTTMPNILATLPEAERKDAATALVHFLATTGEFTEEAPRRIAVNRGEMLFHSVGCVACHDPRPVDGSPVPKLTASISLGVPSRKFALPGLTKFLEDPLAVRPGARMPHLGLGPTEAKEIASFLLNDLEMVSGLQFMVVKGSFDKLPDFGKLQPAEIGEADGFHVNVTKSKDNFAIRFDGHVELPADGDYEFFTKSDDGSRLSIGGKVVVDSDGIHAPSEKSGKIKLTKGVHIVSVEYFEASGGEELTVQVKIPGKGERQDLSSFVTIPKKPEVATNKVEPFKIDAALAAKGKELFTSLGCASCHQLKLNGEAVATKLAAKPLNQLQGNGGCLASQPVAKTAYYALSEPQQKALVAAISSAKQNPAALAKNDLVHRQMTQFNCYACHARGEIGGADDGHAGLFKATTPEMGDEGRLPPPLTGVGAKLQPEWLKQMVDQGTKERPYMLTRMPKFGVANLTGLLTEIVSLDKATLKAAPKVASDSADEVKKLKAAGKKLVGTQGFGCIKCHVFGDKKVPGIQAMSMTTMAKRLNPDWFHHYVINPQAFRPGTRMPTAWPDGKTTLPAVLEGSTDKQAHAVWQYLIDGDKASPPVGLTQAAIELIAYDEAVMYRNFIDGSGPRAIGVGYPEKLNLAFDANNLRLALLWQNSFIDASKHWVGRGPGYQAPLGDNIIKLPDVVSFATLADEKAEWPKAKAKELGYQFKGYRLVESALRPIFMYSVGNVQVEDYAHPLGQSDVFVMKRTLTLTATDNAPSLSFLAASGTKIEDLGQGAFKVDGSYTVTLVGNAPPVLRTSGGRMEVLVPLKFENKKASLTQTFDW